MRPFDQRTLFLSFGPAGPRLSRATGSVAHDEVTEAARRFVEPEGFTMAAVHLAQERLVVLCGAPGTGKRSSALSLLREVTDEAFYLLSPLTDLAEHDYDTGCGYLLLDTKESNLDWLLVRHRVAAKQAYLVVTTAATPPESASHFTWHPPKAERVLKAHGAQDWPEEHTTTLRDALRAANRVSEVVALARRLKAGEPPPVAIEHVDATIRTRISCWLKTARPHEIVKATTLAFTSGVAEPHVETALTLLSEHLGVEVPPAAPTGPVFTMPTVHQHVLSALWQQMDAHFWSAVTDWLDTLVRQPPYDQCLPVSLTKLADTAPDHVLSTLDHWSHGACGPAGQRAAVHTLWLLAHEDTLAPAALRTATEWITQEHVSRRWVAAMAFSGHLGVRYPLEAITMLWHLCTRLHKTTPSVETVFGELFSTLTRESPDGDMVLTALENNPDRNLADLCATATISVRDPLTNQLAVVSHLAQSPDHTETVARLLARTLVKPPLRQRTLHTLRSILEELLDNDAKALGKSLAPHLPPTDRESLARDLPQATDIPAGMTALLTALRESHTA